MLRAFRAAFACALITLAITGTARAAGGTYEQQAQVRAALQASAFPRGVVPAQVVIRSARKSPADAWAGLPRARLTSLLGALLRRE